MTPRLVLDWDGTCTEVDGLHMLLERFGDRAVYERMEGKLGNGLTLHEVIGTEMRTITIPLEEAVAWLLEHVTLRPGFHELAESRRPAIVSSGFHELIEPVLAREGVQVDVLANRLDARSEGWIVRWRDESICETCSESCKRAVLDGEPYVYAGDGYSDRCAALGADRIFARDGLAVWLDAQGAAYERFDDLRDIDAALDTG